MGTGHPQGSHAEQDLAPNPTQPHRNVVFCGVTPLAAPAAAISALSLKFPPFPRSQQPLWVIPVSVPWSSSGGAAIAKKATTGGVPGSPPLLRTCHLMSQSHTRALGFGKYSPEIPSLQIFIFTTQRVKKMFSQSLQAAAIQEFWESSSVWGEQSRTWPKVLVEDPPSTSAGLSLEIYYGQKQLLEEFSSSVGADGQKYFTHDSNSGWLQQKLQTAMSRMDIKSSLIYGQPHKINPSLARGSSPLRFHS